MTPPSDGVFQVRHTRAPACPAALRICRYVLMSISQYRPTCASGWQQVSTNTSHMKGTISCIQQVQFETEYQQSKKKKNPFVYGADDSLAVLEYTHCSFLVISANVINKK